MDQENMEGISKEQKIQLIDYILSKLEFKYRQESILDFPYHKWNSGSLDFIQRLAQMEIFQITSLQQEEMQEEVEFNGTIRRSRVISNIDTLKLFKLKRELLKKTQKSIIHPRTLETVSYFIWGTGNAISVINGLKNCKIPDYLIIYPGTKWRLVYAILELLATSVYENWHILLFGIIEEFLSPVYFQDMEDCIKKQHEFSALLAHSWYEIKKWKIILLPEWRDMYDIYYENSRSWERVSLSEIDKINDFISNKDFKKVTLIKENGQVKQMNGERHIIADDDTKFVQLKHQFPHSDISTSIYNWWINKYIVTEKELLWWDDTGDIF